MTAQTQSPAPAKNEQTMTSLEMAEATGKPHSDLLKSIRKMENSWAKFSGGNFSLANYTDNETYYQAFKSDFLSKEQKVAMISYRVKKLKD